MTEYCCPFCFADGYLRKTIHWPQNHKGKCSFCLKENQPLLEPHELKMEFQPVVGLYVHGGTKPLAEQLGQDWAIWSVDIKKDAQIRLLDAICEETYSSGYYCLNDQKKLEQEAEEAWTDFTQEIKHRNRFFHSKDVFERLGLNVFEGFMDQFKLYSFPQTLYRARVNDDNIHTPFSLDEMKKPPVHLAKSGRANPLGISYLYTGTTKECAIHEVRPPIGSYVSVVEMKINDPSNVYIVDLRFQSATLSPFEIDELELLSKRIPFFKLLDKKMSQAILPTRSELDYLPIQFLCEFIKQQDVDGIAYKSVACQNEGYNIVFFSEDNVNFQSVKSYHIVRNTLSFEEKQF